MHHPRVVNSALGALARLRVLAADPQGNSYARDVFGDWLVQRSDTTVVRLADEVARKCLTREGVEHAHLIPGRDARRRARALGYPIPRCAK